MLRWLPLCLLVTGSLTVPLTPEAVPDIVPWYCNQTTGIPFPDDFAVDDQVDILYLEAPLFKEKFGNLGLYLHLFHVGVGFVSHNTGRQIAFEYIAENGVNNAVFPRFVRNGSATELNWDKAGGGWCAINTIDRAYWDKGTTHVASTNGSVANAFAQWLVTDNATNTQYQLFQVQDHKGAKSNLITPSTCISAAWRSFDQLAHFGATFNHSVAVKANTIEFFGSVKRVSPDDSTVWPEIVEFYHDFSQFKNESMHEIFRQLLRLMADDDKFVHSGEEYYRLSLRWPLFRLAYDSMPLPGQPAIDSHRDTAFQLFAADLVSELGHRVPHTSA